MAVQMGAMQQQQQGQFAHQQGPENQHCKCSPTSAKAHHKTLFRHQTAGTHFLASNSDQEIPYPDTKYGGKEQA